MRKLLEAQGIFCWKLFFLIVNRENLLTLWFVIIIRDFTYFYPPCCSVSCSPPLLSLTDTLSLSLSISFSLPIPLILSFALPACLSLSPFLHLPVSLSLSPSLPLSLSLPLFISLSVSLSFSSSLSIPFISSQVVSLDFSKIAPMLLAVGLSNGDVSIVFLFDCTLQCSPALLNIILYCTMIYYIVSMMLYFWIVYRSVAHAIYYHLSTELQPKFSLSCFFPVSSFTFLSFPISSYHHLIPPLLIFLSPHQRSSVSKVSVYDAKRETDWSTPLQSSAGMVGGHTDPVWWVREKEKRRREEEGEEECDGRKKRERSKSLIEGHLKREVVQSRVERRERWFKWKIERRERWHGDSASKEIRLLVSEKNRENERWIGSNWVVRGRSERMSRMV